MNLNHRFTLLVLASLLPTSAALAGIVSPAPTATITGSDKNTVNRGYAGLKWTLGKGYVPAVVIGFRRAEVKSGGDTQGGDISFSVNLAGGVQPDKLRVKYFNGQNDVQGEGGAGYDFAHGFFVGLGVQGPYSNLGVDYLFGTQASPFEPYFILHTLKKYDTPSGRTTTLSCPSGFDLTGNTCTPVNQG
jgi:hypothetical protein